MGAHARQSFKLIGLAILARMDSARLPGKALRAIAGRPLLGHVLDRARLVGGIDRVVIATSTRVVDDPIFEFAKAENAFGFRGSTSDVLERCIACASAFGWTHLMRISGDSPFFDPVLATRMVADPLACEIDILTNVAPRTFPAGNSIEIISAAALQRVAKESGDTGDREHVTPYIYRNASRFRIRNIAAPDERYKGISLTVDHERDLDMAEWITSRLEMPPACAPFDHIVALQRAWQATSANL
jgi:spore coat polysaccharide biosynthesis protein SpsF